MVYCVKIGTLAMVVLLFALNGRGQDLENIGEQKPVQFSGSLSVSTSFYNSNSANLMAQPEFGWSITGSPTLTLYGAAFPFSVTVSDNSTNFSQPFNRYGVSPKYKWVTAHLGWRSMSFSPFTYSGKSFLGGGVELNPGVFRLATFYGRMQEAIPLDSLSQGSPPPSFKQFGYGVKVGVGKQKNHVDLHMFYAKDIRNSITIPDSLRFLFSPKENLAIGITSKQTIKNRVVWGIDFGVSGVSQDLDADNVEIEQSGLVKDITRVFQPKLSTRANYAAKTYFTISTKKSFRINLEYKRIMPEYNTLGSNFIRDDLESLTLAPSWSMAKRKVNVRAKVGVERNNLYEDRLNTNIRRVGNLGINLQPTDNFTIDLDYNNFQIDQVAGSSQTVLDSFKLAQTTHDFGISPSLTLAKTKLVHSITLNTVYQLLDDQNVATEASNEYNNLTASLTYGIRVKKPGLSINFNSNYGATETSFSKSNQYGFGLGLGKKLFDNKLNTNWVNRYTLSETTGFSGGSGFSSGLKLGYVVKEKHSFSASIAIKSSSNIKGLSGLEQNGGLGYSFSF